MEGLAEQGLGAAPPSPCGKVGITGQTAADADRILSTMAGVLAMLPGMALAYAPLVGLAWWLKAGAAEEQEV
jgi:hypothetical protein